MKTYRTLAATVAIAALAVPAAQARSADIHAPLARAAVKAQQQDDLRSPDTRDAAVNPDDRTSTTCARAAPTRPAAARP